MTLFLHQIWPLALVLFVVSLIPRTVIRLRREGRQHSKRRTADLNRVVADFRKGRRAFHNNAGAA